MQGEKKGGWGGWYIFTNLVESKPQRADKGRGRVLSLVAQFVRVQIPVPQSSNYQNRYIGGW